MPWQRSRAGYRRPMVPGLPRNRARSTDRYNSVPGLDLAPCKSDQRFVNRSRRVVSLATNGGCHDRLSGLFGATAFVSCLSSIAFAAGPTDPEPIPTVPEISSKMTVVVGDLSKTHT